MPNADGSATLADYIAWIRAKAATSEARRKARLEASPLRLVKLKRAAEKRTRRGMRNLQNAAKDGPLVAWTDLKGDLGL